MSQTVSSPAPGTRLAKRHAPIINRTIAIDGLTIVADILHQAAQRLEQIGDDGLGNGRPFDLDTLWQLLQRGRTYATPSSWAELYQLLNEQIQEQITFVERRRRGDYTTDPYGFDEDILARVRPLMRFMYRFWWRIDAFGLENVPATGRALLVANHSGVLPWDGAMIATAIYDTHPARRLVRNLYLHWFNTLPMVAPLFASLGQVAGRPENAVRLLEEDEIVCTFPEGARGVGKRFQQRYQLMRFGRGGFARVALQTGTPMIPVAVVGAEEAYPMIGNAESLARLLGLPFFPITPFFPWLGPVGTIPLPTHWTITFGEPISTVEYGPDAAHDPLIVSKLSQQVRNIIQETINTQLAVRTSIF
ncbi:MAG: acyltransferase family protein [Chloroflexaceae bacterium]|nr:acyltransferase family protein [Chloroflexaceae bacterium]